MQSIHFSDEQWAKVRETYGKYWDKKLFRASTGAYVTERPPCRDIPYQDFLIRQRNCNNFSVTPDQIAEAIEIDLSRYGFYGDAFPLVSMDCFGPGVVAAFLGADVDNSTGRVWFRPKKEQEIQDIHFTYDPDNPWLLRIKSIYRKIRERFDGKIVMGMTDLGGILDILSTFRPGTQLLMDLYDSPEEIVRLTKELEDLWMQYFRELNEDIGGPYSDWSNMYSATPAYIIQCDFSYMIGPDMFKEFVLPTLQRNCREIDHTIYHLDGPGELPHLDYVLSIPELDAVQWVPGTGNPPCEAYPEIYERIRSAGKQIQLQCRTFESVAGVLKNLDSPAGVFQPPLYFESEEKEYALNWLKKLGVE